MSKSFDVPLKRAADEIITRARHEAHSNGIHFVGDEQTGRFTGLGIEGSYKIAGETLSVHIARKPFIMPWGLIESTLRGYFA